MREAEFRAYLAAQNLAPQTLSTRTSALRRVEREEGLNLDEEFERDGLEGLIRRYAYSAHDAAAARPNPSAIFIEPENLQKFLAFYKSAINSYRKFRAEAGGEGFLALGVEESVDAGEDALVETASRTFALERDLQAALRSDIHQLEAGLVIADEGREARVEAGLIDILAKDAEGRWTVIELKADVGRPAVIAQVLAYMASVEAERGGPVRGIIVAADFDPRVELAARAVPNLDLKRYRFKFEFA